MEGLAADAFKKVGITGGVSEPKERIPRVECFAAVEAEGAENLAGEFDWGNSGSSDDALVGDGRCVAVEAASAVAARSEIFAAVAGVVKIIEHSGAGKGQRCAADGCDWEQLSTKNDASEFNGIDVAARIPTGRRREE